MCKRVIRACCYKWHLRDICRGMFCIRQYLSKKKEKREKNENGIWFSFKSCTCTCKWKKVEYSFAIFWFMRFSGWTCESNRYCSNFFTLVQQRLSKAYAINCSWFATGAQNTLHKQQKKEQIKVNHLWPHFLAIPNSPVQFCPFPVYLADNRIHVIHWCWCSLHSHDKSCFLYTRQRLWNHRWKNGILKLCKNCRA